jgi:hypothetical protein
MIALSTSHHFAMGREAAAWVSSALEHTQTPVHWERVSDIIRKRGMERHGADMRYDDGDVRFIIKIPLDRQDEFYDLLSGLAQRNADGDAKVIIGGAWKEPGEEGYFGVRVSQAVGMHLARETGLNQNQSTEVSRF